MNTNTINNSIGGDRKLFSVAIKSEGYQKLINDTLGDPKLAQQFVADISTAVAINPMLKRCEAGSILSAGLVAYTLKLPLNASLGYAYLVPYADKAQFQLGAKGFKQLAMRSGIYTDIDVTDVRDGEYLGRDEETGKPRFKFITDDNVREKAAIIGYLAYFITQNGFKKTIYWSIDKIKAHGKRYSKTFNSTSSTNVWRDNFDKMAEKTVIKQLLSNWGVLSVELQDALKYDQAVVKEDKTPEYVDVKDEVDFTEDEVVQEDKTTEKPKVSLTDVID